MKKRQRGFTIIEAVVVLGIIGIISTLAITTFSGLPARARLSNDFLDLATSIRFCRARAMASGFDVYLMVNQKVQQLAIVEDTDANFQDTTLVDYPWDKDYSEQRDYARGNGDKLIRRIDFAGKVGVAAAGFPGNMKYPEPFSAIDVTKPCTFCGLAPAPTDVGAIQFHPEGHVDIVGGGNGPGGALILQTFLGNTDDKPSRRALLVARPTGISRTYFP